MSTRYSIYVIAYGCLLTFSLAPHLARADDAYQAITEGNELYQQQHYREAAQQYNKAAEKRPNTPEIDFNLGNAAYKQQDYDKAHEHYNRALQTSDPALESQTKYNLGNVNYQKALQARSNPQQAIEHVQTAMTYYRDSLEVAPQQPAARYNLELAHQLLQQLQKQQKQQQNQNNQQKQDSQQQKDKNQQQPSRQGQEDKQQAQQDQQEEKQDQRGQPNQQDQNQQAASQAPEDQSATQSEKNTTNNSETPSQTTASQALSPDEAERLLNAIRDRAREANEVRQQRQRARLRDNRVDKDW